MNKKVAVIFGSDSDLPVLTKTFKCLKSFGVEFEAHIMSAHRTPDQTRDFTEKAAENGFGAVIAAAGMSAHLAGVVAAHTLLPVIALPVSSPNLGGLDALLAMVQMPKGIPVATVAIDGGENAALLAIQILAVTDAGLRDRLAAHRGKMRDEISQKDAALQEKLKEL